MSTQPTDPPPKKPPRVVVPFRASPAGKSAMIDTARKQGYDKYTEWIRDVLSAEVKTPRVKKGPPR